MLKEVIAAVRQAIPDAAKAPPGAVLENVLTALMLLILRSETVSEERPNYGQLIWPRDQNIEVFGSPGMDAEYRKLDSRRTEGGDVRGFTAAWSARVAVPLILEPRG